ncbi:Synaptogyrin-1 [Myotis brandtii]|uniref:Synaptogyrin-1 n=1 Tax=Myotis brandtii TaxID=109478 RepID=S7PJD6_MYOBR|nr:Synaptogyrin-1 [Myotis brandtii]
MWLWASPGLLQGQLSAHRPSATLAGQAVLAFQRYQIGADSALFSQDYMDPSQDSSMPYAPYVEPSAGPDPTGMGGTYQQPANAFDTEPQGYQSQGY